MTDLPDIEPDLEAVRAVLAQAEDVDLPEGLATAPHPDWPEDGPPQDPDDPGPGAPPPDGPEAEALPPEALAARLPLNDLGNAGRLVIHFGQDLIYVPRVGWHVWDGVRWKKDEDELAVRRRAQQISDRIRAEIPFLPGPSVAQQELLARKDRIDADLRGLKAKPKKDRSPEQEIALQELEADLRRIRTIEDDEEGAVGQHLRHAKNAGNSGPLNNMVLEAQTALAVAFEALDADDWAINTESGVLRVIRHPRAGPGTDPQAELSRVPHDRALLMTKLAPVRFDLSARAPTWDRFLARTQPHPEMRAFLARWAGLSLTGHREQMLVFAHGSGANGKSVFSDILARILGDYAATARIESFTGTQRREGSAPTPDLIPLMGARYVRASEPDEGQRLQEGLIKELTGGEKIQVRPLHGAFLEVEPRFKLLISGNHKPDIRGGDDGIWRRVLLVPWSVTIPEAERDPELVKKLWEERDGIFAWAVRGLVDYVEQGLSPPEDVLEATSDYREASDPVGAFLRDCCLVTGDPADRVLSKEMTDAYLWWQWANGTGTWNEATVARHMAKRADTYVSPLTQQKFSKGQTSGIKRYTGIRLTDTFRREMQDKPRSTGKWARGEGSATGSGGGDGEGW